MSSPSKRYRQTNGVHHRGLRLKRAGLIGVGVLLLLLTAYVGVDTFLTNGHIQGATAVSSVAGVPEDQEGKDETRPSTGSLESYAVSADSPRALYSSKLGIAARILPMGINTSGSIQAPHNIFDAGWYRSSARPGEPGAMFIDGHASGQTREGLFAYLDTLVMGDTLEVEKGDGVKLNYEVVYVQTVALDQVDMSKVLQPYGDTERGLNLMTCTGEWLPVQKTYDHRVIVYTKQV